MFLSADPAPSSAATTNIMKNKFLPFKPAYISVPHCDACDNVNMGSSYMSAAVVMSDSTGKQTRTL